MKTNPKKTPRFKLITYEHEALKDPFNYQIIYKKCSPTSMCPRHGHISFCSDHGPKPNPNAKLTKNGPTRVYQRIFRQKFKDEVSLMLRQDYVPHVAQVFSKSRSYSWSISPLFSVTVASNNLEQIWSRVLLL